MRAREPDDSGFVVRDGVRIHYEVFGKGTETIVFLPAWSVAHSQIWKGQIPYFARYARVVTYDGRGNGRSEKSADLDYSDEAFCADALAVLDATATSRATLVGLSAGGRWALMVAARHPERVERLVCIAPAVALAPANPRRATAASSFEESLSAHEGWHKLNRRYWEDGGYPDFLEFFFGECLPEKHSTKQIEDGIGWGLDTTPQTLAATVTASTLTADETAKLAAAVRCPVLVIHGDDDRIVPLERGKALAEETGAKLIVLPGSGHLPQARVPVTINLAIRDFLGLPVPKPSSRRKRVKRTLFISSPIGLGHAQRDLAIAQELRRERPDIEISWLAQHPVTAVLQAHGETIHSASVLLVNESAHFENECAEHDLHAFQTIRRMDEILVSNFMVFYDLIRSERFDLVVGDEAWDVDHFLHENPEEKRTAFIWLTDFVGWIPMPDGGETEARVTADYNAEMIEHIERFPRLRDRSIFVGDPGDIIPRNFGDGLPMIRDWTEKHYDFAGYVTGFSPPSEQERAVWRAEFGYRPDEAICIVSVGGSGVGTALLRRIVAAYPEVKKRIPELRMIVVTGPRIDPRTLATNGEIETHAFVPQLYRRFAACDVAVVQGGLTTTMELTASKRPFVYFPLQHHFEQNFHVRHRLERYGAGRCMQYATATTEEIAEAIAGELRRNLAYRSVTSAGAATAAAMIAETL